MAVIGSLGWFVNKIYTEYTNNWLSVAIALISLSGAVFFADELHKVDCNWFFTVLLYIVSVGASVVAYYICKWLDGND